MDYSGQERRKNCDAHEAMSTALVTVSADMAGIMRASQRLFAVGLALIRLPMLKRLRLKLSEIKTQKGVGRNG